VKQTRYDAYLNLFWFLTPIIQRKLAKFNSRMITSIIMEPIDQDFLNIVPIEIYSPDLKQSERLFAIIPGEIHDDRRIHEINLCPYLSTVEDVSGIDLSTKDSIADYLFMSEKALHLVRVIERSTTVPNKDDVKEVHIIIYKPKKGSSLRDEIIIFKRNVEEEVFKEADF
jgi:hypothetical protein